MMSNLCVDCALTIRQMNVRRSMLRDLCRARAKVLQRNGRKDCFIPKGYLAIADEVPA